MAKILVKTPVTSNGVNPILDAKGQIVYKETILELPAKKILDKANDKLPAHLKKVITLIDDNPKPKAKKDDKEQ